MTARTLLQSDRHFYTYEHEYDEKKEFFGRGLDGMNEDFETGEMPRQFKDPENAN